MQERQTRQKTIIYEALKELDHPTATEVYLHLHEKYPTISRATVFRVLGGFANNGRAQEVKLAGGDTRYDYNVQPHCHVRCRVCGRMGDIPLPVLPLKSTSFDYNGFKVEGFQVDFYGLCSDCGKLFGDSEILS